MMIIKKSSCWIWKVFWIGNKTHTRKKTILCNYQICGAVSNVCVV